MSDPSPELLTANERLLALRAHLARKRAEQKIERRFDPAAAHEQPATPAPASLPPHLGCDSPAVTTVLRARQEQQPAPTECAAVAGLSTASDETAANAPLPTIESSTTTSHFPLPTPYRCTVRRLLLLPVQREMPSRDA